MQQILRNAVTGDHGEQVEIRAERMADFMDALPRDLQNDLHNAIGMEPEAAQQELQEVGLGVLDGDHGRDVQMRGQWSGQTFHQWELGQMSESDVDAATDAG
ncbi:hypothetical protein ACI8AC_07300 [Geodermatophilus sp. SYSU D00758]